MSQHATPPTLLTGLNFRNARSILYLLPVFWTRLLFPGADAPPDTAIRWRSVFVLLLVPGLLLYPSLGFHLLEPDEGRYAEIPREMLHQGEWIVPQLQAEPYLDKPPLFYWLVMLSYQLLGVQDWSARMVPALALHGSILLAYVLGRRNLGERAAFRGALLLSLAPGFLSMGRLLVLDGLLTLWTTLGLLAGYEAIRGPRLLWRWWLVAAAACGLGILTKGPVALILVLPPLWAARWLMGCGGQPFWRPVAVLTSIALIVAVPWYVAVCLRMPGFARYFLWEHNVVRFVSGFDHLRPVWFYVPVLIGGLLPASLLVVPFGRFLLRTDAGRALMRGPALGFLLLAGGWCVFFFSLSGSKLPTYIMPAFPPLALAVGVFVTVSRRWRSSWRFPVLVGLGWAVLAVGHHLVLPWYAAYRSPLGKPEEVARYCADPATTVVCHPRPCDSLAFYLGRDDLHHYRSKEILDLVQFLREHPRTVVLFTHRHSLKGFCEALPPDLHVVEQSRQDLPTLAVLPERLSHKVNDWMGETELGLCDIAVVERVGR
jgi:4-amino-4-deoxy-L-arabinose transferase-like glycosyltransferase